MGRNNSRSPLLWLGLIVVIGICIAWYMNSSQYKANEKLKVYNPTDVNDSLVDESMRNIGIDHRIADFSLLDQRGRTITQKNLEGKIYVADFFFTTCGSICPKMTSQLQRVQEKFKDNSNVMILSHTVLPQTDTVEAMNAYADQYGADPEKWLFLTGDKKEIYALARKSYFVLKEAEVGKGDGGEDDFIHTENFVLVDRQKRIRGYYDGTSTGDVDRLIKEIGMLLEE